MGQPPSLLFRHHDGSRARACGAAHDEGGRGHLAQPVPRAVGVRVLVNLRLDDAGALQLPLAVVALEQAVAHVIVHHLGVPVAHRRLRQVVLLGRVERREQHAAPARSLGHGVQGNPTAFGGGEHDGLEAHQPPQRARARRLGQDQAGGARRVAHRIEGHSQRQRVDDGEDLLGEVAPVVAGRGLAGIAVAAQVEGERVAADERRDLAPDALVKSGGMRVQHRRVVAWPLRHGDGDVGLNDHGPIMVETLLAIAVGLPCCGAAFALRASSLTVAAVPPARPRMATK